MNIVSRLSLVLISITSLAFFAFGFTSSGTLSDGQNLMLWSLIPASLLFLTVAFHTKVHESVATTLVMMFFALIITMVCFGMYKQNGQVAYVCFAFSALTLCGISIVSMVRDTIFARS